MQAATISITSMQMPTACGINSRQVCSLTNASRSVWVNRQFSSFRLPGPISKDSFSSLSIIFCFFQVCTVSKPILPFLHPKGQWKREAPKPLLTDKGQAREQT
eukprot:TRINITY_DN87164_c0_g1_i1.p1 TRINITY_DN87164_c0_g1~~TRINITY_DN87164_c0_g1_i1.p1  ORF type:complete len:103 (+),score=1.36 TRINITY_DN87164_c0_g1_i1:109-417(+)